MFELRSHPSNPSSDVISVFGAGFGTASGKTITETTAFNFSGVYASIRILAETISSLPLCLFKRLERGKEKQTGNPLNNILQKKPNPEMTAMTYRELMMVHLAGWGNSYSNIERNGAGRIIALWPLRPDKTTPKRVDGELVFEVTLSSGQKKTLPRDEVLHIPGMGFNGLVGFSPLKMVREAIGLGLAAEDFGSRFFANDARPGIVLKHPGTLKEGGQDNIRRSWNEIHGGLENKHRIAILEEGMDLQTIGIPPEDAQYLGLREFQIIELARIYRVPPHMLADLTRATFSNIEEQGLNFTTFTMTPWFVRTEQSYDMQLLEDDQQNDFFWKHNENALLRGNIESRFKAYSTGFNIGTFSINDVLELEDRNAVANGDTRFVPLNMIPLDQAVQGIPDEPAPSRAIAFRSITARDNLSRRWKPLFKRAAQRIVNREGIAIKKEIKKQRGNRAASDMKSFINNFYKTFPEVIKRELGPVIEAFTMSIAEEAVKEVRREVDEVADLDKFISDYIERYTERHVDSSQGQLISLLDEEGEFDDRLESMEERVDEWEEKRPEKIARNETIRGANAVSAFVFWDAGTGLVWRTRGKNCPFCNALDGRTVGRQKPFFEDGDKFEPKGVDAPMKMNGAKLHPPIHGSCDCFISPS